MPNCNDIFFILPDGSIKRLELRRDIPLGDIGVDVVSFELVPDIENSRKPFSNSPDKRLRGDTALLSLLIIEANALL
jgi:hypothetical protein